MKNQMDTLLEQIDAKQNPSCIGLDPRVVDIPMYIRQMAVGNHGNTKEAAAEAILIFNKGLIEATHDLVPAYKPNIAFYEQYGPSGLDAFQKTAEYAKKNGCIAIEDGKRNDIGPTAQAYADGHLGVVDLCWKDHDHPDGKVPSINVDMLTINPYLGIDGVKPFIDVCQQQGKGVFSLVRTSNKSAGDIQDKFVKLEDWQAELIKKNLNDSGVSLNDLPQFKTEEGKAIPAGYAPNFIGVATLTDKWGSDSVGGEGFSNVGAVVGPTWPEEARVLTHVMPKTLKLGPGYGAQGASIDGLLKMFNNQGRGGLINNSRGINFAYKEDQYKSLYKEEDFEKASRAATESMQQTITKALREAKKSRW